MNVIRLIISRIALKIGGRIPLSARQLIKKIIPAGILSSYATIYPIKIPNIQFLPNLDIVLIELPQRYNPMMPNGLAYVHNILKTTGLRFQTLDLNIIFYHRFHYRRVINQLKNVTENKGFIIPDDPWDTVHSNIWSKQEFIDYLRPDIDEIVDGLVKARPKIIGISISGTNRTLATEVVKRVRVLYPEVIILAGGYDCVYHYVAPHLFPDFDYMVIGEAEPTLGPLVKAIVSGEKPKDLPGIISKYDSPNRTWEAAPLLEDLDSIDFPRYDWTDLNLYRTWYDGKIVPIISSRGCHWARCRFCCECFKWRGRSPEKVVDEMEWFSTRGFRRFRFNESDMNGDPDTTLAICDEIQKRKLKLTFDGELRVDKRGTQEFFRRLREAGCWQLVFGVDGWSERVLRLQNKGSTIKMVEENLRNCHEAGITVRVNMVIGIPGETEEDVTECIDNILRMKDYIDCFQNLNILILGAGNDYYLHPERYGIKFRGDKQELYAKHPYFIPPDLWYSEQPYIDFGVRVDRMKRIYRTLKEGGINVGEYAEFEVVRDTKALKS